jgi:hypothetical protein
MSIFGSLFGQQAMLGNTMQVDSNQLNSIDLMRQQLANQQYTASQQMMFANYDPPLHGPTRGELEKYPGLKDAWDQWQTIYNLHK